MNYGQGWRVRVEHHHNFAADQVNVWIAQRDGFGAVQMVQAIHMDKEVTYPEDVMLVLGDPIDTASMTKPTFTISHELAQAVFDALAPVMIGTDSANVLQTVANLRRERDDANRRFDKLLDAMSNLAIAGDGASAIRALTEQARARASGGTPPDHLTRSGKVEQHNLPTGNQP
jgi:hypothetical protein